MEVSSEIKEDIRKTQTELKNAIRVHQVWVARLQEDETNSLIKSKICEAEKHIIAIGNSQKLVVDRLRRELELYQQHLRARNKHVNFDNDNQYVAQQLRDHLIQFRGKNHSVSLLKPSVLNEIKLKTENGNDDYNISDSETDSKSLYKDMVNKRENDNTDEISKSFSKLQSSVQDNRSNFENALNKVKEVFLGTKFDDNDWPDRSDSDSSLDPELSPTPSPPPLPTSGEPVTKEVYMRLIGLVTPIQKVLIDKRRSDRRKRAATTNRNNYIYGSFEMIPKRKKLNQFPYLQSHNDPPQTRSAKLRQQNQKFSREGSPSGSSSENKGWSVNKPTWIPALPPGLSVEPVSSSNKKLCHGCGRNDVPSLLVQCDECSTWQHTGCGAEGQCASCHASLPEPAATTAPTHAHLYRDKLAERKRLQEKNIELCMELRKLEARAASLKDNLDEHNAEKRQLLADQMNTQRTLQKLLDFISQFKETSLSVRSTSVSESGSEVSKSNEE
ncbi:uncharacterized protein LOC126970638 [Leptidea sinapis]|uniref:uncharacterized protein LOC126970638 n=1 Tax=Leptidea sinapis TaxID=189913 RepID=UPI002142BBFD|nr:uncharacterized protein LOC126970638 [Leptidea sinapis]